MTPARASRAVIEAEASGDHGSSESGDDESGTTSPASTSPAATDTRGAPVVRAVLRNAEQTVVITPIEFVVADTQSRRRVGSSPSPTTDRRPVQLGAAALFELVGSRIRPGRQSAQSCCAKKHRRVGDRYLP